MIKVSKKVLCLDWDKRSLRLVVARVGTGEMELEDAHAHRIPPNVDPEDPKAMGGFIAQQIERHRISNARVIVDVPRDKAVINRLNLPPTPRSELAAAVRFQALRELPFPLDEAQIDYVVSTVGEDGLATQVLLAAVRIEVLDRIRETCEAAGLTPARIGLRPYANMVSVQRLPALVDRQVLFVDVGPNMTEIDVIASGTLAFSRAANVTVPFQGGELMTDDSRISSKSSIAELDLAGTVESSAVDELLVEIMRTLQAYRASEAASNIEHVVIAGGTGVEQALLEAVERKYNLPTTLFDPTVTLGVKEDDAVKLRAFSSTLGLAWGLSREGLLELDFLNPKKPIPPGQALKRRLRILAAAAAIVLLSAVGWVVAERVKDTRRLADLQAENDKLKERWEELCELDVTRLEAEEWEAQSRAGVWLDHMLWIMQNAIEPGKQMLAENISFNTKDTKNAGITIGLLCRDWEVATEYVKKLNDVRDAQGRRLYKAEQGGWQDLKTIDPSLFKGKVKVQVKLLELTERPESKSREKMYRSMKKVS